MNDFIDIKFAKCLLYIISPYFEFLRLIDAYSHCLYFLLYTIDVVIVEPIDDIVYRYSDALL